MNYEDIARLLGMRISHTTASDRGEYWDLETPCSIRPRPFSNDSAAVYQFKTESEVEAFIHGYSLVVRYILQSEHTPK